MVHDGQMMSVSAVLADRVRDRLRAEEEMRDVVVIARAEIRAHNDVAAARGWEYVDDEVRCLREVLASVTGLGPIQPYLDDPDVEEIWWNAPDRVFVAKGGVSFRVPVQLEDEQVRDIVERMLRSTGRRVDLSQPFVDASLPDGSRVHVTIPDITRAWAVNIRKFLRRYRTMQGLADAGSMPVAVAEMLVQRVVAGASVLIAGPTHAGKTTLLGALVSACPPSHRIVTVEETFELALDSLDVVAMQCRPPSMEGTGEVTLRRLVKEALRMRPDRIVVGEVRDAEALDLVLALNTGVPCAASIHANSAAEALDKLASLTLLAGRNVDRSFVAPAIARSVDLVVQCERTPDGGRRIAEVAAPVLAADGSLATRSLYRAAP